MKPVRPTVGVLMTMLELYRKTAPDLGPRYRAHWEKTLRELLGEDAELHFTGVSHTKEEVAEAVRSCREADSDLLVVMPLSYAPSGAAVDVLTGMDLPLLVVSSARDATLPYDMSADHIMANHAMHGCQDLANVLRREGRPFLFIAGHPEQARFREKMVRASHVALGARVFRRGRVGRIGEPFGGMLDFEPGASLTEWFGMTVRKLTPAVLARAAQRVQTERVSDMTVEVTERFEVAGEVSPAEMETSVRWSLALEDVVAEEGLDAVSMNFLELAESGAETMPFLGASRLMARGVGYAGEGDILTAALVAAVARLAGEATFTEMFCPDYERSEVLLSHMGECNFALADETRPVRLMAKSFAFGECARPLVPVFQLREGPVTLASITQWPGEGFRIVACAGEVLASPEHPNLDSPYSRVRFGRPLAEFLEGYSAAGGTHHLALGYGDLSEDLRTMAELLGVGFLHVGQAQEGVGE